MLQLRALDRYCCTGTRVAGFQPASSNVEYRYVLQTMLCTQFLDKIGQQNITLPTERAAQTQIQVFFKPEKLFNE